MKWHARAAALVLSCSVMATGCTAAREDAPESPTTVSAGPPTSSSAAAGGHESGAQDRPSEVLPGSTPSPAPTLGAPPPALTGAPADAEARDALVEGFPRTHVAVPAGVAVVSSSVSSQGDRVQVGLTASADEAPDDVLVGYTTMMASLGYLASPADAVPGATATQYNRGRDSAVVTVRPRAGGGSELVVVAALVVNG